MFCNFKSMMSINKLDGSYRVNEAALNRVLAMYFAFILN